MNSICLAVTVTGMDAGVEPTRKCLRRATDKQIEFKSDTKNCPLHTKGSEQLDHFWSSDSASLTENGVRAGKTLPYPFPR
jgi:hypothetical protein